jgi:pyridoxamine 5'-phosphate oxidase family protein
MLFKENELEYLSSQHLGRLATISARGNPQNSPVGFWFNPETNTIDIGGRALGSTQKFRNVRSTGRVSLIVDEVVSFQPWTVRGLEVRGTAEALSDQTPPNQYFSPELIRIKPRRIITWGLDPGVSGVQVRSVDDS